jgi:hypothetical protein
VKKSPLRHNETSRTEQFQDNSKLNVLLDELAALLKPVQAGLHFKTPRAPVGSIIGNPRSGTTLFLQWIASLGCFSYPTNFLTRFAYAPYIGALVQKMLFDPAYDFHGDFKDLKSELNFSSELGKSKGALASNEFQHFFRNHMPNFDLEWLDDDLLEQVDCKGISSGLASIEAGLEKPFFTKANILQYNLDYFSRELPQLLWVHMTREPIYVMQSLLLAREQYCGNRSTWFSAKPREFNQLKDLDTYHQIAGQVYFTDQAIQDALASLPSNRWLTVEYESFCEDPGATYRALKEKYAALGSALPPAPKSMVSFEARNDLRLPGHEIDALVCAYRDFEEGHLPEQVNS